MMFRKKNAKENIDDEVKENKNDDIKENKGDGVFMNRVAIGIIILVILTMLGAIWAFSFKNDSDKLMPSLNFKLDSFHLKKTDTAFIIANEKFVTAINGKFDSIKLDLDKLQDIKAELSDTRKKNEDYFRLMLALIGSVFAVVGFFGFKSISDTRQATIDAAKIKAEITADNAAKIKAEYVAKDFLKNEGKVILENSAAETAKTVSKSIAYETAKETSKDIAKEESLKYLADITEFKKAIRQDLQALQRDYNILRSRIQDMEKLKYGETSAEFDNDDENDIQNEQDPVV